MKCAIVFLLLMLVFLVGCGPITPQDTDQSSQETSPQDGVLEKVADTSDLDEALEELDDVE